MHFRPALYPLFKYTLYLLLFIDCGWFMYEDLDSARHLLAGRLDWPTLGATLAQTIDTWAWLGLLLLFELETSILPPASIVGRRRLLLHASRAVCYGFVVYACSGYVVKLAMFLDTSPLPAPAGLCALADRSLAYVVALDNYDPVTQANCAALDGGAPLLQISDALLVGTSAGIAAARWLALTDVINAAAWLLVALVLEIEVWIELVYHRRNWLHSAHLGIKLVLYATLVAAALYWWKAGSFLDFWDASLWIVAFLFIEMNVFNWGIARQPQAAPA